MIVMIKQLILQEQSMFEKKNSYLDLFKRSSLKIIPLKLIHF